MIFKQIILKLLFFILAILSFFIGFAQDAKEIVKTADKKMRGTTMEAEMVIKTTRPTWSREMSCKVWMKSNDLAMILIQSPDKDKGIAFLKRKKEFKSLPAGMITGLQ